MEKSLQKAQVGIIYMPDFTLFNTLSEILDLRSILFVIIFEAPGNWEPINMGYETIILVDGLHLKANNCIFSKTICLFYIYYLKKNKYNRQ